MMRTVLAVLARVVPIGVMILLGLNTLLGCWCGVSHETLAAADPERPVAERGIATFLRSGAL